MVQGKPRVSVITPAYIDSGNKLEWLKLCVGSVMNQTFEDWEMIVVDDCSPLEIAEAIPADARVRVVRATSRQGPAMCRNTGVGLARADALIALDADDEMSPGALAVMFDAWEAEPDKIVYGNMSRVGMAQDVVKFVEFNDMKTVMNLDGIVPVTAMHSKQVWMNAGGWKPSLSYGLEDVEYWIAAAARGHCGRKVEATTLLYRKHEESRTALMRSSQQMGAMRREIMDMHADLFEGRYPMGCCGGGRQVSSPPQMVSQGRASASLPASFSADDKIWVRYNGGKMGTFGVVGDATKTVYQISGTGFVFEVFAIDVHKFRVAGRGKDFTIGVPAPAPPEPPKAPVEEPEYKAPEPKLAQIERVDPVGLGQEPTFPEPPPMPDPLPMPEIPPLVETYQGPDTGLEELDLDIQAKMPPSLSEMGLPLRIIDQLKADGWTVHMIASANINTLTAYKGVGQKTAESMIEEAVALCSRS